MGGGQESRGERKEGRKEGEGRKECVCARWKGGEREEGSVT